MIQRHLSQVARTGIVIGAVLGGAGACSKEPQRAPAQSPTITSGAPAQPQQTFQFAPPDGTKFTRTDRHRQERSITGTAINRVDEDELQWKVAVEKKGDQYRVKQDLAHLTMRQDGKVLADGDVKEGIRAELVIDRNGNLMEVKGLEGTAARLKELAAPGMETQVEQTLTPQYLATLVSNRYRVLFGETIGRPAKPGSSWTVTNAPGSFVTSRKVTVERQEMCGTVTCARLRVDFKVDPKTLSDTAVSLVQSRVQAGGGDMSKVTVKSASYGMSGTMLVEPSTMLSHGASLSEIGSVTVAGTSGQQMTVAVKGTTDITYDYGTQPMAAK